MSLTMMIRDRTDGERQLENGVLDQRPAPTVWMALAAGQSRSGPGCQLLRGRELPTALSTRSGP